LVAVFCGHRGNKLAQSILLFDLALGLLHLHLGQRVLMLGTLDGGNFVVLRQRVCKFDPSNSRCDCGVDSHVCSLPDVCSVGHLVRRVRGSGHSSRGSAKRVQHVLTLRVVQVGTQSTRKCVGLPNITRGAGSSTTRQGFAHVGSHLLTSLTKLLGCGLADPCKGLERCEAGLTLGLIPIKSVLVLLRTKVLTEPLDAFERGTREQATTGRSRPFQCLHAFGHAEAVAGVSLELLHPEGCVLCSKRNQLVQCCFTRLAPWFRQLQLLLKLLLLQRCRIVRGVGLSRCGAFGSTGSKQPRSESTCQNCGSGSYCHDVTSLIKVRSIGLKPARM